MENTTRHGSWIRIYSSTERGTPGPKTPKWFFPLSCALSEVLYSGQDRTWKIADFGLAAQGTSRHAQTTRYARGTDGYRAPELMQYPQTYNNKVDIWAYGCIAYELVVKRRAFEADWKTMQYALAGGKPQLTLPFNPGWSAIIAYLSFIVLATIKIQCRERPSISAILQLLNCRWKKSVEVVSVRESGASPSLLKHLTLRVQRGIDWAWMDWRAYW